jgi:hypothetical protein
VLITEDGERGERGMNEMGSVSTSMSMVISELVVEVIVAIDAADGRRDEGPDKADADGMWMTWDGALSGEKYDPC